jgi:uncharacterized membrane protein
MPWRGSRAVATLAVMIATVGVALVQLVPLDSSRALVVGILLILFGLKWLRKAILHVARPESAA